MAKRKQQQNQRPKKKQIKIGTIVEIPLTELPMIPGFAYVQFFFKSKRRGQCIRIFKGIYQERPEDFVALSNQEEQLIIFYPISARIADGCCEEVGWAPVPERLKELPLFKNLSRPIGFLPPPRCFYHWHLVNTDTGEVWRVGGETDDYHKVKEILPEEYHRLPSSHLIPYWALLDYIELGWTNESEVFEDFVEARKKLPRVQGYLKAEAEAEVAKASKKTKKSKCSDCNENIAAEPKNKESPCISQRGMPQYVIDL